MTDDNSYKSKLRLIVLISGSGSNLQAIIDAIDSNQLDAQILAVISNRSDASGLERAASAGIETAVLANSVYDDRELYDQALGDLVQRYQPNLIILAGFMRILSGNFVNRFKDMILNIHPSLLPEFKGTDTHQRAIDAGVTEHGATVHLVTPELDAGPVILQATVPVLNGDTAKSLATRVLQQEHKIYPLVIQSIAEGKIRIENSNVQASR